MSSEAKAAVRERESTSEQVFVVLCQHLGQWGRGAVVRGSEFPKGASIQAHLRNGAVRVATASEAVLDFVTLEGEPQKLGHLSVEDELSQHKTMVSQLRAEIADKDLRIAQLEATPPVSSEVVHKQEQAFRDLLAEKDRTIIGLQTQIAALEQQLRDSDKRRK